MLRIRITAAITTMLLLATTPAAASSGDEDVVDWEAKHLQMTNTAPFDLAFGPGDGPFLQVRSDTATQGGLELSIWSADAVTDGWDAWVQDFYDVIAADRRQGCDPGYVVRPDPVTHVEVGGQAGIRYGFTGLWPDGRPSERALFHATTHDGQLFLISTIGLADDGCLAIESELPLAAFPAIEPIADRVAAATVIRDAGVPPIRRIGGADRYATAVATAVASFGTGAPTAILANGESSADALTASHLAGSLGAPVLLTPGATLPVAVRDGLQALGVQHVVIVGGTNAISEEVADAVMASGPSIERLAGANRYETAALLADRARISSQGGGDGTVPTTAILVTAAADAVAAGPLAYAAGFPLLLTGPDALHPAAAGALERLGVNDVLIAGGTAGIAPDVESALQRAGYGTRRIAGKDRSATAAAFATLAVGEHGFHPGNVAVVRGDRLADSLVAGPHAGSLRAPVLLADSPNVLGDPATTWLRSHSAAVHTIHVLGGTAAITDATAADARDAATPNQ